MDNRIFNVNGSGQEMLGLTLRLAFLHNGKNTKATGWKKTKKHGLILYQYDGGDGAIVFPVPLIAESVLPVVSHYLQSNPDVEYKDWDENFEHDGDNSIGWRVFCEDWGHIDGSSYGFIAIKPAFMWHGK